METMHHGSKEKVRLIIMSHLSDIQTGYCEPDSMNQRINFIKYLLLKFPNTDAEISVNQEWNSFLLFKK